MRDVGPAHYTRPEVVLDAMRGWWAQAIDEPLGAEPLGGIS